MHPKGQAAFPVGTWTWMDSGEHSRSEMVRVLLGAEKPCTAASSRRYEDGSSDGLTPEGRRSFAICREFPVRLLREGWAA